MFDALRATIQVMPSCFGSPLRKDAFWSPWIPTLGALVYLTGAAHTGIIRFPAVPASRRIALMQQILASHEDTEIVGAIIRVTGNRIRFSRSS